MRKNSVWVSVSASMLTLLASAKGSALDSVSLENISANHASAANNIWFGEDGSVIVKGVDGTAIYLTSEAINLIKNVQPGQKAVFSESKPCVGAPTQSDIIEPLKNNY